MLKAALQICCVFACAQTALAAGRYVEVNYPPSSKAGELQFGVTYTLWLPEGVETAAAGDDTITITWKAAADFESGLQAFVVLRDGEPLGQVPEKPSGRFGRPLFQTMSYHDTPEKPLAEIRFVDTTAKPGARHKYQVIAVNSAGLRSAPSAAGHASGQSRGSRRQDRSSSTRG